KSSLARDTRLASKSWFNLASVHAAKAKALYGEHPEDANEEARKQGIAYLVTAVRHYRDCLKIDPENSEARHDLETVRLWIKHMQFLWAEKDRDKARKEMDLFQFLEMLHGRQRQLRLLTKALVAEPDSPRRREVQSRAKADQKLLVDEIGPLKEKIEAFV